MDSQIRNFKDFLQLYNRLTEMCFQHCADNFFTRKLSQEEENCLDKCVGKFTNVNQRVMAQYVRDQTVINERRMKEFEEQAKANEAAALAAASAAAAVTPATDSTITAPVDVNISTQIANAGIQNSDQPQTVAT